MLGLKFPEVRLLEHSSAWAEAYANERDRIHGALRHRVLNIEHIGSTAIAGICAKPIIDIAIAVPDLSLADEFSPDMANIGYEDAGDGGLPGQRIFGRGLRLRTHLVHVVTAGGRDWQNYLTFREALRTDDELARAYDQLKRSLAAEFPNDRRSYTSAKGKFVERVLARIAT